MIIGKIITSTLPCPCSEGSYRMIPLLPRVKNIHVSSDHVLTWSGDAPRIRACILLRFTLWVHTSVRMRPWSVVHHVEPSPHATTDDCLLFVQRGGRRKTSAHVLIVLNPPLAVRGRAWQREARGFPLRHVITSKPMFPQPSSN